MSILDFSSNALVVNIVIFLIGAALIWAAGTKLEGYADEIAERTGIGKAFIGLLLLAAATSLPELATVVTATARGNASMAAHNLVGGVVIQSAVLAVADLFSGRKALTHQSPKFTILVQAVGLVLLLSVVQMGIPVARRVSDGGSDALITVTTGLWCAGLIAAYLLMALLAYRGQDTRRWSPTGEEGTAVPEHEESSTASPGRSKKMLGAVFAAASLVVLAGGWTVASSAEALAEQTGLGTSFVGFTLVAMATSLPELSTSIAAVRRGNHETAFGNVFGGNAFDVTMLILIPPLAGGRAFLESMSKSIEFATATGIFLTCIYLWGMLEREDRTVWRMGVDSTVVLIVALAGSAVVFWLD